MRALLVVILAGCWHEAPPPVTPVPAQTAEEPPATAPPWHYRAPAGPDCTSLGPVVERVLSGSGFAAQLAPVIDAVAASCTEDDWSADIITCFVAAPDDKELQTCVQAMTSDQRTKLGNRVTAAMQPVP
jgi:hypothetical protein